MNNNKDNFTCKITFPTSSSSRFPYAIKTAKKFNNFKLAQNKKDENIIITNDDELREKQRLVFEVWKLVCNWKGSRLEINDHVFDRTDLNQFLFVFNCYESYNKAIFPENYCKEGGRVEGWGCRLLNSIQYSIPEYSSYFTRRVYWYNFGSFKDETTWIIDKSRILEALEKESRSRYIILCPIFTKKNLKSYIDKLPNQIVIGENSQWEIDFQEINNGIEVSKKIMGIKPIIKEHSLTILEQLVDKQKNKTEEDQDVSRYIPETSFSDIGGIKDIIEQVREVIELPIKRPDIFKYLGIKPHKGIILFGPPGVGKTLVAKAIANEVKAHFILIRGPELLNKYHGQSEENLRNVFSEAQKKQPSIIYFDEIDSIAQVRSGEETLRLDSKFVNQLLTLMDGVEDYGNICIIASTNRIELIDPALMRPGRFDYSLEIKNPTLEGCLEIFTIQTKNMPIESDFNKNEFSKKLLGLSGAEIAYVAREGAYECLRRSLDLGELIVNDAIDTIDMTNKLISEEDFNKALSSVLRRVDNS